VGKLKKLKNIKIEEVSSVDDCQTILVSSASGIK
jgi:hypothetical protein